MHCILLMIRIPSHLCRMFSLARMCPTWLGIRCMTYIVGCFLHLLCFMYFDCAFYFYTVPVLMIRIPSHLCRMFLFVRMCPAWLGIRRMTYWWMFYICYALCILTVLLYLYCIRPNDSDFQSSLTHVLVVRICPTWLGVRIMTYWRLFLHCYACIECAVISLLFYPL